jgi:hypothetical protein
MLSFEGLCVCPTEEKISAGSLGPSAHTTPGPAASRLPPDRACRSGPFSRVLCVYCVRSTSAPDKASTRCCTHACVNRFVLQIGLGVGRVARSPPLSKHQRAQRRRGAIDPAFVLRVRASVKPFLAFGGGGPPRRAPPEPRTAFTADHPLKKQEIAERDMCTRPSRSRAPSPNLLRQARSPAGAGP